jgi:hypothetical protein
MREILDSGRVGIVAIVCGSQFLCLQLTLAARGADCSVSG